MMRESPPNEAQYCHRRSVQCRHEFQIGLRGSVSKHYHPNDTYESLFDLPPVVSPVPLREIDHIRPPYLANAAGGW